MWLALRLEQSASEGLFAEPTVRADRTSLLSGLFSPKPQHFSSWTVAATVSVSGSPRHRPPAPSCLAVAGISTSRENIVEPGCQSRVAYSSAIEFNKCPSAARRNPARHEEHRHSRSGRCFCQTGCRQWGRRALLHQRYELLDNAGKPVLAGDYVTTVMSL